MTPSATLDAARRRAAGLQQVLNRIAQLPLAARTAVWSAAAFALWLVLDNLMPRGLPLGIVLFGCVFGGLYALTAVGLVLVYKANRVVNFAQAELGAIAAVFAIQSVRVWKWNYFAGVVGGLLMAAFVGALVDILVIRRFKSAPRLLLAVATIGVAQVLAGASIVVANLFGAADGAGGIAAAAQRGVFSSPIKLNFRVFPVAFKFDHLLVLIAVPAVIIALGSFLRFSAYGIAVRGSAENADRASLLGVPVPRLSTIVWSIAAFLSAITVVLRTPLVGFSTIQNVTGGGNALLVRTLAAAVIARMDSLPRAVIAAIGIGIFQELAAWTWSATTVVDALLVVVILVGLLSQRDFFSRMATAIDTSSWKTTREVRPIPSEMRRLPEVVIGSAVLRFGLLAVAASYPLWASPSQTQAASLILIYSIVAVSLLVLTGWAGHISLGQFALVGFGGAATAFFYGKFGWDFTIAAGLGIIVATLVALVIGLPALRIRGPFLAVTTLAFAVTASSYLLEDRYFGFFIQSTIERPVLWGRVQLGNGRHLYFVCLVALLLVLAGARSLRNSRTGRAMIAARENFAATESVAVNTTRLNLGAFAISGAIAGVAGVLYVVHQGGVYTGSYTPEVSIRLFSMVVIGGLGSLPGAVLGAVYVRTAEFFLPRQYALLASGTGILLLLLFLPEGLGGLVYRARDMFLRIIARRRRIVVPSLFADTRDADLAFTGAREKGMEFLLQMSERLGRAGTAGPVESAVQPVAREPVPELPSPDETVTLSGNGKSNGKSRAKPKPKEPARAGTRGRRTSS